MRTRGLLVCVLLACLLLQAAPAYAWQSAKRGVSTHDWIVTGANRLAVAAGYDWLDAGQARAYTDLPDYKRNDARYHQYDVWGTRYGNSPARVDALYRSAVARLKAGDRRGASQAFGLLAHYYSDTCQPMNTDQSRLETARLKSSYENAVKLRTNSLTKNSTWVRPDGVVRVPSARARTIAAARWSHGYYRGLVGTYARRGYDLRVSNITRATLSRSSNDLADLLKSAWLDAGWAASATVAPAVPSVADSVTASASLVGPAGRPLAGAEVTFNWHLKGRTYTELAVADASGIARSSTVLLAQDGGYPATVDVSAFGGGGTAKTSVGFVVGGGEPVQADAAPTLVLLRQSVVWSSIITRELAVTFAVRNEGTAVARTVLLTRATASDGVTVKTATPVSLGDIPVGATRPLTVRYTIPIALLRFDAELALASEN